MMEVIVDRWLPFGNFPLATLLVNTGGCLLMGMAFALLASDGPESAKSAVPFFMTGFLGGYTTMSAYALDAWQLINDGRFGEAIVYMAGTVILAFVALVIGIALIRWLGV